MVVNCACVPFVMYCGTSYGSMLRVKCCVGVCVFCLNVCVCFLCDLLGDDVFV